jgi:AP-3 complex subunit beta
VTEVTLLPVLRELDHYSKSSNPEIIHEAICGVARCAMKCSTDKSVALCSTILKGAILSNNGKGHKIRNCTDIDSLSAPAILALRMLIQINPVAYAKYIHLLAQSIQKIHSSSAWAEVIWLAGEHAQQLEGQEADILRISLQDFADQGHSICMPLTNCKDEEVKLQIITLATKVYAKHFPNPSMDVDLSSPGLQQIDQMYQYAMSLARYDVSYNLRDRARYLRNLSANVSTPDRLFVPKPVPRMTGLGEKGQEWNLGSVAQVVGRDIPGEISLPDWGEEIPEPGVRNPDSVSETMETLVPVTAPKIVPETSERKKEKKIVRDLDKFYASENESDDGVEYDDNDEEDEEETSSEQERNVETDSDSETDEESYVHS